MAWLAVAYTDAPSPNKSDYITMQVQVLATLGSLSGISYPSRVQAAISVAKLANLDLVRSARTLQQAFRCAVLKTDRIGGLWLRSASGSSSNGLQLTFAHRLLHKQHRSFPLADGHRALHHGHSRNSLELAAGVSVCDAATRWSRILRPCGSRADECTLLRCTPYAMPGWRRSSCCICAELG